MRKFYSICTLEDADNIAKIEQEYIECAWSKEQIIQSIQNENYGFIKCEVGLNDETGELDFAGYGAIQTVLDEANVCNIAVYEKYRNQSIGTGILNSIIRLAKFQGAKKIFLEVAKDNVPAIGLYEKLGFKVISERKNYYKSGDALIMSLDVEV